MDSFWLLVIVGLLYMYFLGKDGTSLSPASLSLSNVSKRLEPVSQFMKDLPISVYQKPKITAITNNVVPGAVEESYMEVYLDTITDKNA